MFVCCPLNGSVALSLSPVESKCRCCHSYKGTLLWGSSPQGKSVYDSSPCVSPSHTQGASTPPPLLLTLWSASVSFIEPIRRFIERCTRWRVYSRARHWPQWGDDLPISYKVKKTNFCKITPKRNVTPGSHSPSSYYWSHHVSEVWYVYFCTNCVMLKVASRPRKSVFLTFLTAWCEMSFDPILILQSDSDAHTPYFISAWCILHFTYHR